MRLIIVRHGETDTNRAGLPLGRADVPLNERGRQQAQLLACALAPCPLAAVYSSPLARARQTASAIADSRGLPLRVENDLTEMDIGLAEGLTFADLRQRFPDFMAAWRGPQVASTPMPGGESLLQVQARAWSVVAALAEAHPDDTVAIVSHNFVIVSLLCRLLGLNLASFRHLRHDIAAITTAELRADRSLLVRLNDVCHLRTLQDAAPGKE